MQFWYQADLIKKNTTTRRIRDKVTGIDYKEFHNYGHFCLDDMNTVEFPELLEMCLQSNQLL